MTNSTDLRQALFAEREASFFRLKGGYPVPVAGAIWWAGLGVAGYLLPSRHLWIFLAFVTSGTIFPLAIVLAWLFKNNFMRDKTPVSDLLFPGLISMALFWPLAISAWWSYPPLVPLILAIGMSILWPVIGWTYGRTAIFTAHAVVRAIVCFILWNWFPSTRFTILPLAVSAIYLITIGAILISSSAGKKAQAATSITIA